MIFARPGALPDDSGGRFPGTDTLSDFAVNLRAGKRLVGTLIALPSPEVAEILARAGFDWLFLDAEHGPFAPHQCLPLVQAAAPCPCLIRVPAAEPVWIGKALDVGAAGIIVPRIDSAADAERAVACAKYPPQGSRGLGLGRAHGYGASAGDYLKRANRDTVVVVQVETRAAVEDIEAIAAVAGIDAVLIGPNDLAASLGRLGELDAPEVVAAIDRVAAVCGGAGVAMGFFGATAEALRPYAERGFPLLVLGVDSLFLLESARAALAALGIEGPGRR